MSAALFDRLYRANTDPWAADTRWYEERKRALLLASLGHRHYPRGYEIGCGNGNLTVGLASRCVSLFASDVSGEGLALAKARFPTDSAVSFERLSLPREWPAERFDLIVLSEVLYFLDDESIVETAARANGHLTAGGEVIACNWRPHIEGYGHSGEEAHRLFERVIGLPRRFEYADENFLLAGWTTAPSIASADR